MRARIDDAALFKLLVADESHAGSLPVKVLGATLITAFYRRGVRVLCGD